MAHARATRNEERFDINENMDHVRINDDEGCFKFDDFADSLGLSKATRAILRKKELITIDALKSLSSADIKKLRLSQRQTGLLSVGIQSLHRPSKRSNDLSPGVASGRRRANVSLSRADTPPLYQQDSEHEIDGRLNKLIQDTDGGSTDDEDNVSWTNQENKEATTSGSLFDPRAILILKSKNKKTVHITEFIPEHINKRRAHRNKNSIGTSNEAVDYAGITIDEWGAANGRLLNFLLSSHNLARSDIEYYIAYTTQIFDFATKYTWASILVFDQQYRELQAHHGFKWGTFAPQLEMQLLQPKTTQQPSDMRRVADTTEECRMFRAKGSCSFGSKCKFRHVKINKNAALEGSDAQSAPGPTMLPKNG